jgi:peptidoglycan hydrolase CwlO-like protein
MPSVEVIITTLTILTLLAGLYAFLSARVRSYKEETIKEVDQVAKITELEKSKDAISLKVRDLEEKLEGILESSHLKDVKLTELTTTVRILKEALITIESDIKELISMVGRGN